MHVKLESLPNRPLVTIIVPSYNQGKFIRNTLESIFEQSYEPIEILVIDGASTDETLDVLKSLGDHAGLKWISEPDRGVVEAVNKGFALARGEIVAIQSSDDCYTPGAIARVVREFIADPQVGLIYGDTVKVDEHGNDLLRPANRPVLTRESVLAQDMDPPAVGVLPSRISRHHRRLG